MAGEDRTKVTTSVTDWATECAKADASDVLDGAAGRVAVENSLPPVQYVFSNGRKFRAPKPQQQ